MTAVEVEIVNTAAAPFCASDSYSYQRQTHQRWDRPESGYILPRQARNWRSNTQHMSRTTLNVVIKRLGGAMRDFCPHDLRSTARSYLRTLGCRDDVIERSLNHSLGGLAEIYQAGDLIEERREALAMWADLLGDAHLGRMLESRVLPPLIRKRWKEEMDGEEFRLPATMRAAVIPHNQVGLQMPPVNAEAFVLTP